MQEYITLLESYLEAHPKKYLIFDFDETIATLILPWETYVVEMKERMYALDQRVAEQTVGMNINDLENEAVRIVGERAVAERRAYSRQFETDYLAGQVVHKPMVEFIRTHAATHQLYLWTSNMRTTVEPQLVELGIEQHFVQLITKNDVQFTKPDPEGFTHIQSHAGGVPEDYLFIGDSTNDKRAAAAAGISFFCVKAEPTSW